MLFHDRREIIIRASLQDVFAIVGDIARHPELAGSGEIIRVRMVSQGPLGPGARFEAEEEITLLGMRQHVVATSEIVAFEPPRLISWISTPASPIRPERIQWWFRLIPADGHTRLIHEVEIDLGPLAELPYRPVNAAQRAYAIAQGMAKTLQRVKRVAEETTEMKRGSMPRLSIGEMMHQGEV
jgi:uncharacterized protein YndB with AHSA1/START domain